jgi:hypothetical protein
MRSLGDILGTVHLNWLVHLRALKGRQTDRQTYA